MAENTDAGTEMATSTPPITDGATSSSPSTSFRHGKRRAVLALIIIVAFLAVLAFIAVNVFHVGQKVYAQAAGHKVYKKDVVNLIGNTNGVNEHQAAQVLADKYLYEAMLKKAGIKVSAQDVKAKFPDLSAQQKNEKYAYQSKLNSVYMDKLIAYNTGLYRGQALVANFSRNIAFQSPFIQIQMATNPNLGNAKAVAADKEYARKFINKLYSQVKSGAITFDEAIDMERDDPVVGEKAYPTLSHSGDFDTSNLLLPSTSLVEPKSIQPKLASMKTGQLSEPFAVKVPNSWSNKKITTESYYLVVHMDYTKGSHSGLTWDKYLAKAKEQYGYKVNV